MMRPPDAPKKMRGTKSPAGMPIPNVITASTYVTIVTRTKADVLSDISACRSTFRLCSMGEKMSVATSLNSPWGQVYLLKYDTSTCACFGTL